VSDLHADDLVLRASIERMGVETAPTRYHVGVSVFRALAI
jgi:hypothetical protein